MRISAGIQRNSNASSCPRRGENQDGSMGAFSVSLAEEGGDLGFEGFDPLDEFELPAFRGSAAFLVVCGNIEFLAEVRNLRGGNRDFQLLLGFLRKFDIGQAEFGVVEGEILLEPEF